MQQDRSVSGAFMGKVLQECPIICWVSLSAYNNYRIAGHIFTNFSTESGYQNFYIRYMFGGIGTTTNISLVECLLRCVQVRVTNVTQ
jgi:hypothetical protein